MHDITSSPFSKRVVRRLALMGTKKGKVLNKLGIKKIDDLWSKRNRITKTLDKRVRSLKKQLIQNNMVPFVSDVPPLYGNKMIPRNTKKVRANIDNLISNTLTVKRQLIKKNADEMNALKRKISIEKQKLILERQRNKSIVDQLKARERTIRGSIMPEFVGDVRNLPLVSPITNLPRDKLTLTPEVVFKEPQPKSNIIPILGLAAGALLLLKG